MCSHGCLRCNRLAATCTTLHDHVLSLYNFLQAGKCVQQLATSQGAPASELRCSVQCLATMRLLHHGEQPGEHPNQVSLGGFGRRAMTSSSRPNSFASSADLKWSRSSSSSARERIASEHANGVYSSLPQQPANEDAIEKPTENHRASAAASSVMSEVLAPIVSAVCPVCFA